MTSFASCPVRDLSSPLDDQSARCPVRELAYQRVVQLPRVSRLRRSQPPFSLWRHSHYDVIRCWAGHAQRYKRTDTLPRLIYKDITQFARSIYAKQNEWTAAFTWCCARPCIHQLVTSDCTSWSDSQPSHIPAVPVEIRPAFDNYHHNHHHRHSHRSLQHQQPDKVEVKDVILVTGVSAGCSSPFLVLLSS